MSKNDYATQAVQCEAEAQRTADSERRRALLDEAAMWRRLLLQDPTEMLAAALLELSETKDAA